MLTIMLSGKMTGIKDANKPLFDAYEKLLTHYGYTVINPSFFPLGLNHSQYMSMTMPMVKVADALFLLPGWECSVGANMERDYAIALDKDVITDVKDLLPFV